MSLKGHLEDLGLAEILHVVGAARRSGLMRLMSRGSEWDVLFRRGEVVAARESNAPAWAERVLVRLGALDESEVAGAAEEARRTGRPLAEVATSRGRLGATALSRLLEGEVEQVIAQLSTLRDGTFEFRLLESDADGAAAFEGLVLATGIPHARLAPAPDRRSRDEGRAPRGRLLVPEDEISLPGVPLARLRGEETPAARPARPDAARRIVLMALPAGDLRKAVTDRLALAGTDVRPIASLGEAELAAEAALDHGARVAVLGYGSHAAMPGLELLARMRSVTRSTSFVLVGETALPAARQGQMQDRATRLGVQHLALVPADPPGGWEAVGSDLADRLLGLLQPPDPDGVVAPLGAAPEPGFAQGDAGLGPRARRDAAELASLSRVLTAGARDASEIALALLDVASEWFDRGVLLLRGGGLLRPIGAFVPHGDRPPESLLAGRALQGDGEDVIARAVRENRAHVGAPGVTKADADALRFVGAEHPSRIAVIPLLDSGSAFAALYGDDGGGDEPWPDLGPLARFLAEIAPSLASALQLAARRSEAMRLRRAADA